MSRSRVAAVSGTTAVWLDGASGKGAGAATAGAKGVGAGMAVGTLGCLGAGPLAPLCFAVVVPSTMLIGATAGAVVGAVISEDAEVVEAKRAMLSSVLTSMAAREAFVTAVQRQLSDRRAVQQAAAAETSNPEWIISLDFSELATIGGGPDKPYALRAASTVTVRRNGEKEPEFVKVYMSEPTTPRLTAQWRADEHAELRTAVTSMVNQMAVLIADELTSR